MGAENNAMLSYLEDDKRFADLFNQLYFKGQQVVDAEELAEASEVYHGKPGEKGNQRTRDIKRRLKSGKELKILAVESQSDVNYIMPWRIMDYDCREYGKQIRGAQRANRELAREGKRVYAKDGERLSEVRKEERFAPVYTLCLYHGAEDWDGPRSLKDMMDFGEDSQGRGDEEAWRDCFADYPMRLVCANELADCSGFRTSLRELFAILFCRRDKERLKELLDRESAYQNMDEETAQTLGVLMGIKGFAQNSKRYRTEKGEYDMCQAIREMVEDSRMAGKAEGIAEGEARGKAAGKAEGSAGQIIEIIENIMKELQCSLEKACKVAGKTVSEYRQSEQICGKV